MQVFSQIAGAPTSTTTTSVRPKYHNNIVSSYLNQFALHIILSRSSVSSPPQRNNRFPWHHHMYRNFFETSPRCSVAYDKPNNSNMALNDSTVCRYFHILSPCIMISLLEMWLIQYYNGLWHTRWKMKIHRSNSSTAARSASLLFPRDTRSC